ncbi:MAG: class I SAM-dependent methyltransferase [Candidatus Omnitrophica bacterium]|nr:class I SAM-dependent methyltransferase [Candidatus Omnitrophota bacterium]MBU1924885.1 class I SAM-dependent methyltransferase [Candidatus Omnitrophota bacterium]MBU2063258.1 class I SAM-dependent methyltransferase [Candidatus Omnitrophota bacterium]
MLEKIYYWLHNRFSKPQERGEYSAGRWQEQARRRVLELCGEVQGRLLEVGCGEGLFLEEALKKVPAKEIFGIDIWQDILERAKARLRRDDKANILLSQADGTSLPFKDNSLDCVVCVNVFFNLPDLNALRRVLGEITRVCRSGGKVIFDIRNRDNPFLYFKYKFAPLYDATVKNLPLKTYRFARVREYLEEAGLKFNKRLNVGFPNNRFAPVFVIEAVKQ